MAHLHIGAYTIPTDGRFRYIIVRSQDEADVLQSQISLARSQGQPVPPHKVTVVRSTEEQGAADREIAALRTERGQDGVEVVDLRTGLPR